MKNKKDVEANYQRLHLQSPYNGNNPPKPCVPETRPEPDKVNWAADDQPELMAPSPAEVVLTLMKPGFIHDFVLAMRGSETTTLLSIWGALFTVSCVLQRRSWQDWTIERLYPNLYLLFLARPGVCKKTVSITFGAKILTRMTDVFEKAEDREIYPIPVWQGGTTPEYLFELLKPKDVLINGDGLGFERTFPLGSRLAIVADELSEFLGRQKYNQGMVSRLTKLYDCPSVAQIGTRKDKTQEARNVFVNFCGGTTPSSFKDIIPEEAKGGGLMSRCVIVWEEQPTRIFHRPVRIKGAPDIDELTCRVSWIAEHRMGEYMMTKAADELYHQWYHEHKTNSAGISDSDTRLDILLVKTAHLIAASTYEGGTNITETHIQAAIELMSIAMAHKRKAERELMTAPGWSTNFTMLTRLFAAHHAMTRQELLRRVSYALNAQEVNKILSVLVQSGQIEITHPNGTNMSEPSTMGAEIYTWRNA